MPSVENLSEAKEETQNRSNWGDSDRNVSSKKWVQLVSGRWFNCCGTATFFRVVPLSLETTNLKFTVQSINCYSAVVAPMDVDMREHRHLLALPSLSCTTPPCEKWSLLSLWQNPFHVERKLHDLLFPWQGRRKTLWTLKCSSKLGGEKWTALKMGKSLNRDGYNGTFIQTH